MHLREDEKLRVAQLEIGFNAFNIMGDVVLEVLHMSLYISIWMRSHSFDELPLVLLTSFSDDFNNIKTKNY